MARRLAPRHPVADARLGEGALGVLRVLSQLVAKSHQVGAERRQAAGLLRSPDPMQQMVAGHHLSAAERRLDEHVLLRRRRLHRAAGYGYETLGVVDDQAAQHIRLGRLRELRLGPLAQGRLYPRHQLRGREGLAV